MACSPSDLQFDCTPADLAAGAALSAWEAVCKSFADAATEMFGLFGKAFVAFPPVDLSTDGIRKVYALSLGLAGLVAGILFLLQVIRTVITHDGSGLAHGIVGIGKAALAFMATLTVAGTALVAADQISLYIVNWTFGSAGGLEAKLTGMFMVANVSAPSLLLLLGLIGIILVAVLWFELLLRNAAVAVLIATSPIAAAGMVSEATKAWWSKFATATVQLIVLKPIIALVFAVGFRMFGDTKIEDLSTLLASMLILVLAALAWPAVARFFTFASVSVGGGTGLAAVLGFAAGQASSAGGGGGAPVGVSPEEFGKDTEARTMSSFAARGGAQGASAGASSSGASATAGGGATSAGSVGAGSAGAGAAGAGAAASGVGAAVLVVTKGLEMAQRGANSLVGRMEQTAGHAGLDGASPHPYPAGYPRGLPLANRAYGGPSGGGTMPADSVPAPTETSGGGSSGGPESGQPPVEPPARHAESAPSTAPDDPPPTPATVDPQPAGDLAPPAAAPESEAVADSTPVDAAGPAPAEAETSAPNTTGPSIPAEPQVAEAETTADPVPDAEPSTPTPAPPVQRPAPHSAPASGSAAQPEAPAQSAPPPRPAPPARPTRTDPPRSGPKHSIDKQQIDRKQEEGPL